MVIDKENTNRDKIGVENIVRERIKHLISMPQHKICLLVNTWACSRYRQLLFSSRALMSSIFQLHKFHWWVLKRQLTNYGGWKLTPFIISIRASKGFRISQETTITSLCRVWRKMECCGVFHFNHSAISKLYIKK